MKVFVSAAALALVLSAGSASAACSTSALAGKWSVAIDGWCTLTISSAGKVSGSCSGGTASGTLALSSACKLSGKIAGMTVSGRTDANVNLFVTQVGSNNGSIGFRQ